MYTISPQAPISTSQFEQSVLQSAVKKRISVFQYLQKMYTLKLSFESNVVMRRVNIGMTLYFVPKRISKDYIQSRRESRRGRESSGLYSIDVRTSNYMILGMSVSGLLELQGNLLEYLKAYNQLLHEYEYHSTHEPGSLSGKPKMVDKLGSKED